MFHAKHKYETIRCVFNFFFVVLCWFVFVNICYYLYPNAVQSIHNLHSLSLTTSTFDDNKNDIDGLNDSVVVIISSCAETEKRWNLLSSAIDSFEKYNTYRHVVRKIVMYDCNDYIGFNKTKSKYHKLNYEFYITSASKSKSYPFDSKPNHFLKAWRIARSFLEAINKLNTSEIKWIFRTEDDWIFYRHRFIEISLSIIKHNKYMNEHNSLKGQHRKISAVQLRNIQFHKPYRYFAHFCGGIHQHLIFNNHTKIHHTNDSLSVGYVITQHAATTDCFWHFGFNPQLLYIEHLPLKRSIEKCLDVFVGSNYTMRRDMERCIGCQFRKQGFKAAHLIEHGYVGHGGMIDNTYHGGDANKIAQSIPNVTTMNSMVESVNGNWSLHLRNCTYFRN